MLFTRRDEGTFESWSSCGRLVRILDFMCLGIRDTREEERTGEWTGISYRDGKKEAGDEGRSSTVVPKLIARVMPLILRLAAVGFKILRAS